MGFGSTTTATTPGSPWAVTGKGKPARRGAASLPFFVEVGRAETPVGAVVLAAAILLRFGLPVGLTLHAEPGKRHRLQPPLGDLLLAALADPVGAVLDPIERILDRLQLPAVAVREDEVDLALALLAGEGRRCPCLVFGGFAALFRVLLDLGKS
jgi:hypothetical protein